MKIAESVKVLTDNLIQSSELEIIYTGELKNSKEIFINYGYDPNSFNYSSKKLDNNNSVKITLSQPGFFYFFFSNEAGKKDNNYYKDYQLYIKTSNLILTQNSSMKEIPYRYISNHNSMYKTFYTAESLRKTSKINDIIIPKAFDSKNVSAESQVIDGFILEPIKNVEYTGLDLIPTENISTIGAIKSNNSLKKFNFSINNFFTYLPKFFEKNN